MITFILIGVLFAIIGISMMRIIFKPGEIYVHRKGWAKIEKHYSGCWAWTEYYYEDGSHLSIYDLIPEPGFPY